MIPDPPAFLRRCRYMLGLVPALLLAVTARAAVDTAYAVQASAAAQSAPAQITPPWTAGPIPVNSYAVPRREPGASTWSPLINLVGTATNYTDTNVTAGRVYEYQIVRQAPALNGYGYVAAGI